MFWSLDGHLCFIFENEWSMILARQTVVDFWIDKNDRVSIECIIIASGRGLGNMHDKSHVIQI